MYYVALDADDIADELWAKHPVVGTSVGTIGPEFCTLTRTVFSVRRLA